MSWISPMILSLQILLLIYVAVIDVSARLRCANA